MSSLASGIDIGDVMIQFMSWQMLAGGADHAQMAAVLKRFYDTTEPPAYGTHGRNLRRNCARLVDMELLALAIAWPRTRFVAKSPDMISRSTLTATVVAAGVALFASSPAWASGTTTYASSTGANSSDCTDPAQPCELQRAISSAPGGGEVVLAPGTYTSGFPIDIPWRTRSASSGAAGAEDEAPASA